MGKEGDKDDWIINEVYEPALEYGIVTDYVIIEGKICYYSTMPENIWQEMNGKQ